MSSQLLDKKLCSKHKLDIMTIDIKQSTADEDQYPCIKCLMEKIYIQNMALVEETKIMIKQMKSEQTSKIKEYQRKIEIFRKIQIQVKELKLSINNTIDKVQCNLQSKLTFMENELEESESKTQISSSLENTKVVQNHNDIKQIQSSSKKEENAQKTPSLSIQCNKHGKEIIMFNLNSEKTKFSRLACIECIQSNDPMKYTTLDDANFKWNEYLGQTSYQVKQFQNQRCLKSKQIIETLEEIQEKYNSTILDIINEVNIQFQMFSHYDINEYNESIIYDMNIEQINELTEILSQTDKFQALTEKQFNIQKEDLNQIEVISTNFGKLLQQDILAINQINNIYKDSNNQIIQEENNIYNQQSIQQLNLQFQHLTYFVRVEAELKQNKQDKQSLQNQLTYSEKTNLSNQQIIIEFKQHDREQIQVISDLRNEMEILKVKVKELEQQKSQFEDNLNEKKGELSKCQQSNQKNEEIVKQLQPSLEQQFSQSLIFSTTYKHNSCSVTQNAKVIENNSIGWYCCMSDQMIPKNGVIQFAFKIIECADIMIGIGFRDIVQSKGFRDCYSIGGGTYNIHYQGCCYNHDQQDKDNQKITFSFSRNDIIIVEVDIQKKYVKWTKQSTNLSFTLTIDTSKDLYPCVHLLGRCKIEILNQSIK